MLDSVPWFLLNLFFFFVFIIIIILFHRIKSKKKKKWACKLIEKITQIKVKIKTNLTEQLFKQ